MAAKVIEKPSRGKAEIIEERKNHKLDIEKGMETEVGKRK